MKQLTINVDMDGVIYCMMPTIAKIANQENVRAFMRNEGYPLPKNLDASIDVWEIWEAWDIPKKAFWKIFYLAINEGLFTRGEEVPDAIKTISRFIKDGHRIRIVTSKNLAGKNETLRAQSDVLWWLHSNAPWYNKVEIAFAQNKQGYDADIIIDDKPSLSWKQKGKVNILFDRPWNEWVDAPGVGCYPLEGDRAYRAVGWEEVAYIVDRMAA